MSEIKPCPAHGGLAFEVDHYIVSGFILEKLIPVVGFHPYPLAELCLMVAAICRLQPTHIFEWGTHVGKSARIFHETKLYFDIKMEIHSVDLPDNVEHEEHPGEKRARYVKYIKDVNLYQGDGVSVALDIYGKLNSPCLPLFYIDGDHEQASVARELKMIHGRVENANILLHDTFYQTPESGYNIGPYLAVQEFLSAYGSSYQRMDSHLGLPGMTLLYRHPGLGANKQKHDPGD